MKFEDFKKQCPWCVRSPHYMTYDECYVGKFCISRNCALWRLQGECFKAAKRKVKEKPLLDDSVVAALEFQTRRAVLREVWEGREPRGYRLSDAYTRALRGLLESLGLPKEKPEPKKTCVNCEHGAKNIDEYPCSECSDDEFSRFVPRPPAPKDLVAEFVGGNEDVDYVCNDKGRKRVLVPQDALAKLLENQRGAEE